MLHATEKELRIKGEDEDMKLKKFVKISGVMEVVTGLSIGGNKDDIGPGGSDTPVIKNPLDNSPYVPGTSIKGKMRSKLEEIYGVENPMRDKKSNRITGYAPCNCGKKDCIICKLFGAHMNTKSEAGTPRVIFKDMYLTEEFASLPVDRLFETKNETMVDRRTHTASASSLRNRERVAKGVKFGYEILVQIYDGDNEKELLDTLKRGLELIEETGLGGKTTGGYGRVSFGIDGDDYEEEHIDAMTGKVM